MGEPPTPEQAARNRALAEERVLKRKVEEGVEYRKATADLLGLEASGAHPTVIAFARLRCAMYAPLPA